MANSLVIIGSQWGDEGKGKVVDWLMQKSDIVVRFQGGHNAGHTLVINGKKIVLHLLPSGVLHKSVISCLGNGMVVSLPDLFHEIESLANQEIEVDKRVKISESCHLLLPYHVQLDKAREVKRGSTAIGTTCKGIGPAYEDKVARRGIRIADLLAGEKVFRPMLEQSAEFHNFVLEHYYGVSPIDVNVVIDDLLSFVDRLQPMVCNISDLLVSSLDKRIIFEGAQGAALDVDHGTYPYVTSSNTSAAQASIGSGIGPLNISNVLGITKVYTTRVGSGPFPTELDDEDGAQLSSIGMEIGATTGRKRRCGWLDIVALRHSIDINSINKLCLTKLDVLDTFATIKICTAYNYKGKILHKPPIEINALSECVPIYEELSGWQQSTVGLQDADQLPEFAKVYINRISELLSIPISLVSTSPERDHFIEFDSF
jgi:adenylosuccinate synthase